MNTYKVRFTGRLKNTGTAFTILSGHVKARTPNEARDRLFSAPGSPYERGLAGNLNIYYIDKVEPQPSQTLLA